MMEKIKTLLGKPKGQPAPEPDDSRPIKFIEEGPNVWRVVYADTPSQPRLPNPFKPTNKYHSI